MAELIPADLWPDMLPSCLSICSIHIWLEKSCLRRYPDSRIAAFVHVGKPARIHEVLTNKDLTSINLPT
jgi:hypothetical protein